ncbi:kinase-like protein [Rhizopogon salebrosus TDB-379]|nr:kinase-like protein [Rhizopogon salebrosus TDB-379]
MPMTPDEIRGDEIRGDEKSARQNIDLTQFIRKLSEHPIAQGGFGDIWKCILTIPASNMCKEQLAWKNVVAVKVIRSHTLNEDDRSKKDKRLRRELEIWRKLQHENILPLYGLAFGFGPFAAMVCPWAKNGSLTIYLESRRKLTIPSRLKLLSDVANGLDYLHSSQVVHGDLSGSNVLVMDDGTACLSDFGLSGMIFQFFGASNFTSTISGNIRWGAPELFAIPDAQDGTSANRPSKECDIYSFGSIMLQVLSGKVPYYYIKQTIQVILLVVDGNKPRRPEDPQIADDHWSMIQSCWSPPEVRPISGDVLGFIMAQRNLVQS